MRKVVCAACGLVNLESFPTFPLCAGCGARLPQRKRRPLYDLFQRPVKTLVWAFSVGAGVTVLAMLSTGLAREARLRDRGKLIVNSSLFPDTSSGGTDLVLRMRVTPSYEGDRETIRNLRLRFNEKVIREADIRVVSPPAATEIFGEGRYFVWQEFAAGQTITVRLRPHQALTLNMVANGFDSFTLPISPTKMGTTPLDSRPNRSN